MELLYSTSREAAAQLHRGPWAFLPVGAFHDRGGLPVGVWSALARYFGRNLAGVCGGFVLPGLPFSSVPGVKKAPGNVQIPHRVFREYLEAVTGQCLENGLKPAVVSCMPDDDGLPYIISREHFERTGYPLLWIDVPGLIWKSAADYLPAGDGRLPPVLVAAAYSEWGKEAAAELGRLLRRGAKEEVSPAGRYTEISRTPAAAVPLPPAKTVSRSKGERLVKNLCRRFAEEVPAAFEKYLQHLAGRKSYRRPVKGFPVWAG